MFNFFLRMGKFDLNFQDERLRKYLINRRVSSLPYDNTNPIIYDKDDHRNCYTDEYLMALASAGDIKLVGMITSSSVAPYNQWVTPENYQQFVAGRLEMVNHARKSGFSNIPNPTQGPKSYLEKPISGNIEDTKSIGSEGSWQIVAEARKATAEKPLVLVMCGPLTVAADAYLLDKNIADKMIVTWFGGRLEDMGDYNGWADGWAAYIVLKMLKLIQFPVNKGKHSISPYVPKHQLTQLPESDLRRWMINKQHPDGSPGSCDLDAPPAISLMRKDYAIKAKHVSFSHWIHRNIGESHEVPAFKEDPDAQTVIITKASRYVATKEWWRALKNLDAYKQDSKICL